MEVLRSDSGEFHLKNIQGCSPLPGEEEILDGELDEDNFSSVSGDGEPSSPSTSQIDNKSEKKEESPTTHSPPITTSTSTISSINNLSSTEDRQPKTDYSGHRDRIVKELKEYEERWLAHRNFLLYTQSFPMKQEDRERVFSQLLNNNNNNPDERDQHHMSKEERDRYLSSQAAFYSHYPHSPHLYNFHNFNPYLAERLLPPATSAAGASSFLSENKDNRFHSWQLPRHSPTTNQTGTISTASITATTASASTTSAIHQPPTTTTTEQSSSRSPSSSDSGNQSNSGSTTEWTYEEQFKQLYELSDEPKRKEFLDDLFSFMQKRGTPVNRIPIMAKHVLDLYDLFRLVVSKGGLVEVINKKLWREVTKGLNLPSSITSAAFTLRTQYMKYLYPYECEKLQLSSPGELQAAIEGNRREGRRPSYAFEYSSPPNIMPPPPPPQASFLNSPLLNRTLENSHGHDALQHHVAFAAAHPFFISRDNGMNNEARAFEEVTKAFERAKRSLSPSPTKREENCSPVKKVSTGEKIISTTSNNSGLSAFTKLKIIAKDNSDQQEKSITISVEVNGISYQGTLYANSI